MADHRDPLYRRMFEAHPDPMWVYDQETMAFLAVNSAAIAHYGYSQEEFLAMTIKDIRPKDDIPNLERVVRGVDPGLQQSGVWRHIVADGGTIFVEINSHAIEGFGRPARVVIARDVTEQKDLEAERARIYERLRKTEERYRDVFEEVPISVWVEDWSDVKAIVDRLVKEGVSDLRAYLIEHPEVVSQLIDATEVVDISRATLGLFKADSKEAVIDNMRSHKISEFERQYFLKVLLALAGGATSFHHEGRVEAFDGSRALVDSRAFLPPSARKDWSRLLTLVIDVTDERMTREKLRESEGRYRRIVETSPDVVCRIDRLGNFLEVSERATSMWGYSPTDLIGTSSVLLVHPEDKDRTFEAIASAIEDGGLASLSNRNVTKDGEIKNMLWSALWSDEDQTLFCTGRDVTEWVRAEAQVSRSQRLEAVGQLTGGVAHDFNNLLQAINASLDAIADPSCDSAEREAMLGQAFNAVWRGSELTRQLLAFSRQQPLSPMPVQLITFVESLLPLMRRTLGEQVAISFESHVPEAQIFVDPAQLDSAIINLALNARDAMPGGGHLRFAVDEAEIDDDGGSVEETNNDLTPFDMHDLAPGSYFVLEVSDDGEGMAEAVRTRIFEPFFTTKEVGKGSGLGLSMVFGFMAQSKGKVSVYSEIGRGTTFRLYFRKHSGAMEATPKRVRQSLEPSLRGARVLVVEDNDVVRQAAVLQLKRLGYVVVEAADGIGGLEILKRDSAFDLLFSDVVMPGGLDGVGLADEALKINPKMRILLTSGFPHSQIDSHGYRLLSKPYRTNQLLEALDRVMAE